MVVQQKLIIFLPQDVAEPLMDLKQAVDEVQRNPTFKCILGTLLSVGNFLNGTKVCRLISICCTIVLCEALMKLTNALLVYH